MKNADQIAVRLDKWLWAARFFKTRQLAVKAIKSSQVSINGNNSKAASLVNLSDRLMIKRGLYTQEIEVMALRDKRGSATVAQTLYTETKESITQREALKQSLASQPKIDYSPRKPQKRSIRINRAVKRGEN